MFIVADLVSLQFFFPETTRPRALIFNMQHHLMNFYQAGSNYAPGAKIGLSQGSHVLHRLIKGKHVQFFLSETTVELPLTLVYHYNCFKSFVLFDCHDPDSNNNYNNR